MPITVFVLISALCFRVLRSFVNNVKVTLNNNTNYCIYPYQRSVFESSSQFFVKLNKNANYRISPYKCTAVENTSRLELPYNNISIACREKIDLFPLEVL